MGTKPLHSATRRWGNKLFGLLQPVVHMAHLVGNFFGMSGLVMDMQGKHIAFVGDHSNGCYLVQFVLPPQKRLGMDKGKITTQHCKVWDTLWQ